MTTYIIHSDIILKAAIALSLLFGIPVIASSQNFYDIETINTIELIFSQENWDEILDSLVAAGNDDRLAATAIINGEQFDSVGVRYKGNSSYNPNQVKNPWNIKLDWIYEDQLLDGYGTLKLANCFKDPSFVRETLSYEIARNYMPASKANYANVIVNGELIGLYSNVQDVDKFFLNNHFQSEDNAFFKGELEMGGGPQLTAVWGYYGPDSADYEDYYEIESDWGWYDLIEFLNILNNNPSSVEEVLDVDRHLWRLAFDILMVNLDGPVNFAHNFYLYKDATGQFNHIIWDLNENFGSFSMLLTGGPPLSLTQMQQLDPFLNISNPYYPIINKILSNLTYQKMYIAHMKTLLEENFYNDWYINRALEIQEIIDQAVQADPNKFYTYSNFLSNLYNTVGFGPSMVVGIAQLMEGRESFLGNHYAFQGVAPVIADITHLPEVVPPNSTVWFNANVVGASMVKLGYRFSTPDRFETVQMFDDGNHNDGAAGDGIYGQSVDVALSGVQYYVYAENTQAAAFSPMRAEYEYYVVDVTVQLAINEFMADNETTIADPQGEYDDWIELYNNTAETWNLNGFYLTDDMGNPDKWAFPDTSLESGGFLLVWADEDEGDPGLHTNFKLSAAGEEIGLFQQVGSELVLMDEVIFGPQEADNSYGRYPDGVSDWYFLDPTPGWENALLTTTPNVVVELTYVSGSPIPSGGGNVYFDVYIENQDVVPLNFDAWLEISYEGGAPVTVVQRSFTNYLPGWTINRPGMYFPVPGSYGAGNYTMTAKVGEHPDVAWDESSFPWVKLGSDAGDGFVPWAPDGMPDPFDTIIKGTEAQVLAPTEFALFAAHPNPFNPSTALNFKLQAASFINLSVYDIAGRQVAELVNGWRDVGQHEVMFDGSNLASGIYIYRLRTEEFEASGKMVLLK